MPLEIFPHFIFNGILNLVFSNRSVKAPTVT